MSCRATTPGRQNGKQTGSRNGRDPDHAMVDLVGAVGTACRSEDIAPRFLLVVETAVEIVEGRPHFADCLKHCLKALLNDIEPGGRRDRLAAGRPAFLEILQRLLRRGFQRIEFRHLVLVERQISPDVLDAPRAEARRAGAAG